MIPQVTDSRNRLTEAVIRGFETELRVQLPAPYRRFLLEHNGGQPEPDTFIPAGESEPTETVNCFLALGGDPEVDDLTTFFQTYRRRIPDGYLPVADDAFGNLICIGLSGGSRGKVYLWDHEKEEDAEQAAPMRLIAKDWDTFLSSFQELSD